MRHPNDIQIVSLVNVCLNLAPFLDSINIFMQPCVNVIFYFQLSKRKLNLLLNQLLSNHLIT